jgi:hypothetical protein
MVLGEELHGAVRENDLVWIHLEEEDTQLIEDNGEKGGEKEKKKPNIQKMKGETLSSI